MKKQTILELVLATVYAFGITPYLLMVAQIVNIYLSVAVLAITLFGYYKFIKWVEEVF